MAYEVVFAVRFGQFAFRADFFALGIVGSWFSHKQISIRHAAPRSQCRFHSEWHDGAWYAPEKDSRMKRSPSISADAPETGNPMSQFPILLQGLSEQNAERAKEHWQTMKSASEKLAATVRDSYSTATNESVDYCLKVMANVSSNAQAALELATALAKAKTPSEIIEISSAHVRRQMEIMVDQNRQLWTAASYLTVLAKIGPEFEKNTGHKHAYYTDVYDARYRTCRTSACRDPILYKLRWRGQRGLEVR